MIRYRFYIGTRDGQDSAKEVDHAPVREYLVGTFGGYSASTVAGAWTDAGKVYEESSVVYEVLADGVPLGRQADRHASALAKLARQKCVLWTVERVQGGFARA